MTLILWGGRAIDARLRIHSCLAAEIPAIFLDWAGTAVDHGSIAPVNALENIFREFGMTAPRPLVRRYMGLAKKDHIRKLLEEPYVKEQWTALHHAPPQERDVDDDVCRDSSRR